MIGGRAGPEISFINGRAAVAQHMCERRATVVCERAQQRVSQSLVARITIVEDYQVLMILSGLVRLESPSIEPKEA